jgi:hypothetical protein
MNRKLKVSLLVLCLAFSVGFAQASSCDTITFSNVPPHTFECMKTGLQNYGIHVPPGNSGELSGHGIVGNFVCDGESKLTLQITNKPIFVSCRVADSEIEKFVRECQGSRESLG